MVESPSTARRLPRRHRRNEWEPAARSTSLSSSGQAWRSEHGTVPLSAVGAAAACLCRLHQCGEKRQPPWPARMRALLSLLQFGVVCGTTPYVISRCSFATLWAMDASWPFAARRESLLPFFGTR